MSVSLKPLSEQTVVIAGAPSGIGFATVRMATLLGPGLAALFKRAPEKKSWF